MFLSKFLCFTLPPPSRPPFEERRANDDVHNPGYLRVPRRRDLVVSDGKHGEVVEEGEEDDENGIDGAGGDEDQDAQREDNVNRTG